jgi:hypothetical protein
MCPAFLFGFASRQTPARLEKQFSIRLRDEKSFALISETMHSTPIDARAHHAHNPLTSLKQGTSGRGPRNLPALEKFQRLHSP